MLASLIPPALDAFDQRVFHALTAVRNPALDALFGLVTNLGSSAALAVLVIILFWYLRKTGKAPLAWGAILAYVLAQLLSNALKLAVGRPRPPLATLAGSESSFPSGHATLSAAVLFYIAFVVTSAEPRMKVPAYAAAALAAVAVAFSRVWLGEHWLSDTVAGFILGSLVAFAAAAVVTRIQRGGKP